MDFATNYVVVRDVGSALILSASGFIPGPFVYFDAPLSILNCRSCHRRWRLLVEICSENARSRSPYRGSSVTGVARLWQPVDEALAPAAVVAVTLAGICRAKPHTQLTSP
jgi:hypothetical protein